MNDSTNESIKIPKFSLTAFRLTYSTPEMIAQAAECLLLGGIPDIWLEERSRGLFASTTHYAKKKIKEQYKSASAIISSSIRSGSGSGHEPTLEEGAFNLYVKSTEASKIIQPMSIVKEIERPDSEDDDEDRSDSTSDESSIGEYIQDYKAYNANGPVDSRNTTSMESMERPHLSPVASYFTAKTNLQAPERFTKLILRSSISNLEPPLEVIPPIKVNQPLESKKRSQFLQAGQAFKAHPNKHVESLRKIPSNQSSIQSGRSTRSGLTIESVISNQASNQSTVQTVSNNKSPTNLGTSSIANSDTLSIQSTLPLHLQNDAQSDAQSSTYQSTASKIPSIVIAPPMNRVQFKIASNASRSKVSIAMPSPQHAIDMHDLESIRTVHTKFLSKVKAFAKTTKGRMGKSKSEIRLKLNLVISERFEPGEILRKGEMLVMTKEILNSTQPHTFTDNENADSRVHERWTEYMTVLRRTDNDAEPLALEFYDLGHDPTDPSRSPDFSLNLSDGVDAHLYSEADKSLCITSVKDGATYAYILKCHNQVSAIRFLYFLKQSLGERMDPNFSISIPEINVTVTIELPYPVLSQALNHRTELSLQVLKRGYKVEYSPIIAYLREKLFEELSSRHSPEFDKWMENQTNPWFCFKIYDRLEWVMNNSELFFVQNQVMSAFRLECRDRSHYCTSTFKEGIRIEEPVPIEGFLSRMTNSRGKDKSLWKPFYKLLYFYTSDNLLFYTKYYKAIPPSPGNELIRDMDHVKVQEEMPLIYRHNPFRLDEGGHIPWLNLEDFEMHDLLAVEELERRSQQLIKSDAMLDMCLIRDIRRIPLAKVSKMQIYLMGLLWYSKLEPLTDEEYTDSSFEIEMINGSVLKLQAPSSQIRDEWVSRLWKLREYWMSRKRDDLMRVISVREENQNLLKLNEYTDSNVMLQSNIYELRNSIADPMIHNIDSIAMSRCILMSGFLYQKSKKHADFNRYYVVLCPGFIILYSIFERSKKSGVWKKTPVFRHYFTISISQCYLYSGNLTAMDLLERHKVIDLSHPERHSVPKMYTDGWKSSEEELIRCFTLWIGRKRRIKKNRAEALNAPTVCPDPAPKKTDSKPNKNPGLATMIKRLGLTGKSIVFMARSRQEREAWTNKILTEIDRFGG